MRKGNLPPPSAARGAGLCWARADCGAVRRFRIDRTANTERVGQTFQPPDGLTTREGLPCGTERLERFTGWQSGPLACPSPLPSHALTRPPIPATLKP